MTAAYYLAKKILDWFFTGATFSPPTLYLGLSTADPGPRGATLAEPSGNSYTRVATTTGSWSVAGTGNGQNSNATALNFPTSTGSWGTIVTVCLFDASTSGNLLAYGSLTTPQAIANNNTPSFAIGALTNTLS
jgi:hypothetical protein